VTTLFGTPEVQPKSKHTMLPILTALFLISYGLMTLLIVEQGSTIQSQRTLIQQLLGDSTQLSALKGKAIHQQAQAPKAQADVQKSSPVQAPSTQAVPSEKASTAHNHGKVQRPMPEKPPVPASDIGDARRTLMSI
jgi:FtsP/CotA-like multicopper oxidase with cupredoxin domain